MEKFSDGRDRTCKEPYISLKNKCIELESLISILNVSIAKFNICYPGFESELKIDIFYFRFLHHSFKSFKEEPLPVANYFQKD